MGVYKLKKQQLINADIKDVWAFFTSPNNLAQITPDHMGFKITSEPHSEDIYPGQIITYKVSPILRLPMFWMTEITHVIENKLFVDEQRMGPYSMWHHEHHFEVERDKVLMTDIVYYKPPLGIIGNIANALFIRKQLDDVFKYREEAVNRIFNN